MGQHLSSANLQIVDLTKPDSTTIILSGVDKEDVNLFLSSKVSPEEWIKQIQNNLSLLSNVPKLEIISQQIDNVLMENVFLTIITDYTRVTQEIKDVLEKQEQLKRSLVQKLEEDKNRIETHNNDRHRRQKSGSHDQHFSLGSKFTTAFKSAERNVSSVVHYLFESGKHVVDEASSSNFGISERQMEKILLEFSTGAALFKDVLPVLNRLIFDTVKVYNVRNVFKELNDRFKGVCKEWEKEYTKESQCHSDSSAASKSTPGGISSSPLSFLTSIGAYPNQQVRKLHEKVFTGQFISVFVFAHIDFDNTINASKQFESGSVNSSMSFEFDPNTFKQLFHIIEQISVLTTEGLNTKLVQILTICLRLFTTHWKVLRAMTTNLHRDLLATNENMKQTVEVPSSESNKEIDLNKFITDEELRTWLDTLLILACQDHENPEQTKICREASKAIVLILDKRTLSFIEKFSFIHKYILENEHCFLIEQFLIELNTNATLLSWIEVLCDSDNNKPEKATAFTILYSLMNLYFNPPSDVNIQRIEQILQRFQQFLFVRLVAESGTEVSSLVIKYLTHLFKNSNSQLALVNDILVGLCLMTGTEKQFNFAKIQSIFTAVLPLLTEFVWKNPTNEEFCYWLLGKMSHVLIVGSPQDPLEIKCNEKLQSPLFAGGCETITIENNPYLLDLFESNIATDSHFKMSDYHQTPSSSEQEFLMSIYNNIDQGAQLISKMKLHIKDKQRLVQKSIEQQANDACAALFAVYIKHYRRIDLAKSELSRANDQKPHYKLVSIFEYANRIQTLFATTRGQGGDCNELAEQIKMKTRFLLSSVKETNLIPIIGGVVNAQIEQDKELKLKHQYLRRKIEKPAFRLLRHMLRACIRFKKLMLAKKKAIEQKQDNENVLHRAIETYVCSATESESNELIQSMLRQYERAMMRLITYRFVHKFLKKVLTIEDKNRVGTLLTIYLPHLRNANIEWFYLEKIPAINVQLKEEIGNSFYSIIQIILSDFFQSNTVEQMTLVRNMFNLLNFSYELVDISYLHTYGFLEKLSKLFVSFVQTSDSTISIDAELIGYNWFRFYVFKLCEHFEMEELKGTINSILEQKREFVFQKLIFNELKQRLIIDMEGKKDNAAIGWFTKATTQNDFSLCTNQWLMFLLRSLYFYEHVRFLCATIDYIEELLDIYQNSQNQTTILLALKIFRKLILFLPESTDRKSSTMIESFLKDSLVLIGDSFSSPRTIPDIVTELIYIYRTMISFKSPWQMLATQTIFDTIASSSKSFEINQMKNNLASLCVLGGYIHPFCLASVVQIDVGDEINNETQLAVIIDIDINARDLGTPDVFPYLVQYCETNLTEWVSADRLRIEVDVPAPNLLALPNANEMIHSLFDALAYFIQIDTSTTESLFLLQLKRRSISVLYRTLNNKKLVELFLQKPYASIIAKLSLSDILLKNWQQPTDLRRLNKRHLEQYSLSLDRCEHSKQIIEEKNVSSQDESSFIVWTDVSFEGDRLTVDLPLPIESECVEWKPIASKREIEWLKRGRIGNDEIQIVPIPSQLSGQWLIEECGLIHRFPGRAYLISENSNASLATFVIDNLRLSEGNWYFCVRLLQASFLQIGWATPGFQPSNTIGIGNDKYSWSYDGSQGMLYNQGQYPFLSTDVRWNANDVCGCGIEIDGDNTRINYWLNGQFLGTAFTHQFPMDSIPTLCDMLPNGRDTTYFPGVSLKVNDVSVFSSCEFIFSPEDMFECPLPNGYKPLLMPTLIHIENLLVPYPFSAYLVDDQIQDYMHRTPSDHSESFLRDFVNDQHLETTFTCVNHQLILPENSGGLPLVIDHHGPLTISFHFQPLTKVESVDLLLLKFDTSDAFSVRIPSNKINHKTRIAILFHPNDRQTKIYINNVRRIFDSPAMIQFNVHILPTIAAGIQNLAIWKYALTEEHIRRLFTFDLSHIAVDYHRLNEHRKQANTFTFTGRQQHFADELLVPLNGSFDENKWEQKKKRADQDESKYFKLIKEIDQSTIQLFGNETYLVLDKSNNEWLNYTLILDISMDHMPKKNEQVTLVTLNSQSEIQITTDGQLCLSLDNRMKIQSESKLKPNEYVRLLISVQEKSIKIYLNGLLALNASVDTDQLTIKDRRIDLFREKDLTKNTTSENTLRLECKSMTYLNRATTDIDECMKSPNYSLHTLVAPPYSIIAPSLIRIGYDEAWIESVLDQNPTTNIQLIDSMLREMNHKCHEDILSKLVLSIDKEKLKDFLQISEFDTDEKRIALAEVMLVHWNEIRTSSSAFAHITQMSSDKKWFHQTVHHLNIDDSLTEWIRDKSTTIEETNLTHQLIDLDQPVQEQTMIKTDMKQVQKSIQYSHRQISPQQYFHARIACEYGLISIYAHYTILNMLRVWSNDGSNLFPLEKLGDCTFIVTLLRLLDYHYRYTRLHSDENIDRMSLLTNSILKVETNELLKHQTTKYEKFNQEILPLKAPVLYQLQKDMIVQSIEFLSNPSLLVYDDGDESIFIDKQTMIKKANFDFLLKLVHIFVKLVSEKSTLNQDEIDFLTPILFPVPFINLLFDLFLLSPMHQSKTVILRVFSSLMKASNNFILTTHIQYFLFHLFVELSPNPTSMKSKTMRIFESVLVNLVFLLFERQKDQRSATNITDELDGFDLSQFPQSFHDLLMMSDVINALTEKTKHTSFPEMFLLQSIVLLGENLQLNRDDIEKSNIYFDTTADLQLMSFINSNPLIGISTTEFLSSLPTESAPNPTYYKTYPSLWHIPAVCIQTRAKLLCQFSMFMEQLVSITDFSLLPGQSILTDKIRAGKAYMLYSMKFQLLSTTLALTQVESDDIPTVNFDTVGASISADQGLHTMFNQAFEQLHSNAHLTFRKSINQLWRAQYLAMHSTDQGGPFRDSISWICSDICSTRLSLFILCPNGRTNSGLNRDRWIPNVYPPNKSISNRVKKQYRFIGQLMGMAIRKKHYLDLKFPILLWKQLVREQVTIEDIEAIDIQSFTMVNEMEKTIKQSKLSIDADNDINDLLSSILDELRFEVVSSSGQTFELVPGGSDIPITASNFQEYCTHYREYRLNEFYRQIEFIRQGLYSVIPGYFLSLFTPSELEEAVCGKGEMNIELFKRNTSYGGHYNQNSLAIDRFWTVLSGMFTEEQKKLFLKFVWGRCTLPNCDDDFTSKFRIDPYDTSNGPVDGALPRSHTCSFVLDLPEYSSVDIMYDRLNYAITYCSSIDGDGNMNENPVSTHAESDWTTDEQ